MNINSECSVLVSSCDSYEDIWFPFFSMFRKMWSNCPYSLYLNTESKDYQHNELNITCLHPRAIDVSWSERLKQALERIDSKYIILVLEDFFFFSPVRGEAIQSIIDWFDRDDTAGFVCFNNEPHYNEIVNNEFSRTKGAYEINLQLGFWRKEYLLSILRDESPWGFETYARFRAHRTKYKNYTHLKQFPKIFDYHYALYEGYGVYRGRWLQNNPDFFHKHGIDVDFSKREFIELDESPPYSAPKGLLKRGLLNLFKNPSNIRHYSKCIWAIVKTKTKDIRITIKGKFFNP